MSRLFAIALVFGLASPALAADPGTCLTEAGQRLAPHTDPADPACGEDCGAEGTVEEETLCSTADGTCGVEADEPVVLRMPAPNGPRCLEPGPYCSEGDPWNGAMAGGVIAVAPRPDPALRPASGTLPGAGPPEHVDHTHWIDLRPGTPPPRA